MTIIDVQNVTKKFPNHKALDDLSLSISEGRIFGLLGPNGAGKTSLIRILTRISIADSGQVLFYGVPLSEKDVQHIGYLPEERGLYKKMKISDQAIYMARLRGLSYTEAEQRLRYWFKKFDILGWWNRRVEELSKGMQQKIQFIITVVHQPKFIIFDEPFSGFDPLNADILKKEILELKNNGTTILLSTHNMASVEEICDDIVMLNHGKNVLSGTLHEVKQRFKKNQYHLQVSGDIGMFRKFIPSDFQIIQIEQEGEYVDIQVQMPTQYTANELLTFFVQHCSVCSFNEVLPSMNDIFIQMVQQQTNSESHA